ncbi:hypothetical protein QF046_001647 [Microbacterium sp. W4I4]|uniref:twin-arginine translocation signal domain-containing protein n=1 Tax=Microbacterium sp. W4I4 TaxID=3042295 RepID=UPI00277ECB39|nr:twin-arginine translocation signal domain-containing protein [Microbacterium sp. W4I4]MDQ0614006.1 hypothetical protein [Microbacterium sp. W4I4]
MISRRGFLQASAVGLGLSAVSGASEFRVGADPRHFNYEFALESPAPGIASGVALFAHVAPRLGAWFPLAGMVNDPSKGTVVHLYHRQRYVYVRKAPSVSPMEVTALDTQSFTLTTVRGHRDGAGVHTRFSFSRRTLTVSGTKSDAYEESQQWSARQTWREFANSISAAGVGSA